MAGFLDVFRQAGLRVAPVKDEENPKFLQVVGASLGGSTVQPRPEDFTDQLRAFRVSSLVYRCAVLWAEAIMQARIRIFRERDGKKIEEINSGPVWDMLREINGHISLREWIYAQVLNIALTGNSYTWKVRDRRGNVVEMWPFRPDEIEVAFDPLFDPKGKLRYDWRPLGSGLASFAASGPFAFSRRSLLHLKLPNPISQVFGIGPVRPAHDDILADQRAKKSTIGWLENESVPAGVLSTDQPLNEDEAEIIKQRWRDAHGGPARSGRMAVLGAGMKFTPIVVTPKDIEWLNQRKMSRAGILMAFGVPPIYAGLEGENFANRKEQRLLFWQDTIRPKMRLLEAQLSEFLLRDFDPEFVWVFDESHIDAFVEQLIGRIRAASTAADPQKRIMRPFEVRERILDIDERFDGDDEFLVVTNTIPAKDALAGLGVTAPPGGGGGFQGDALPGGEKPPKILPGIVDEDAAHEGEEEDDEEAVTKFRVEKQARMSARERGLVKGFIPDVQDFIEGVARDVIDRINRRNPESEMSREQVEDFVPDASELERALFDVSKPHIEANFEAGFEEGIVDIDGEIERRAVKASPSRVRKQFDIPDDVFQTALASFITERTETYAPQIVSTFVEKFRSSLIKGIEEGERMRELAARVEEEILEQSRARAIKIARTEVRGGLNRGNLETYNVSAVVQRKQWLTARDARVRGALPGDRFSHRAADRQIVNKSDPFIIGGERLQHPLDPSASPGNIIQCRCSMRPIVPGQ